MEAAREPVMIGAPSDAELSDQLLAPVWTAKPKMFYGIMAVAGLLTLMLFSLVTWTLWTGIGLWGNNIPVAWAFAIINFVWWIGIGHAGTFISAILLLLEQRWRTSINRFAEAMTLFAVVQAGMFPLLHLGRPWFLYWLFPYPAVMKVWPNFRSALPWDAAAVTTYATVSLLFWYLGLVPDLAAMRDRAPGRVRRLIYGVFALGWRGSARHFQKYRIAYGLLAGLATPLVISVHSIVSADFAITQLPGWHSTIFPPYFVAGAIFSGFAMVLTLMVPVRRFYGVGNVVTLLHVENVCKMILATGWVVIYSYACEFYLAWYGGEASEMYTMLHGWTGGPNASYFWISIACNTLVPQLLWFGRVRRNEWLVWGLSLAINVGMWTERFSIIVLSLQRDYLPSSWHGYHPTFVDWGILAGTVGFFTLLFMMFLRFVPFIPVQELKELAAELRTERAATPSAKLGEQT